MNNPSWVKDYMQKQTPQIREQITVLRRPIQRPSFSGTEPNGSVNPQKPVAVGSLEMHQGEGVIPAHIMMGPVGRDVQNLIKDKTGRDFPQEVLEQLTLARDAVFKSWDNPRAVTYRKLNKIPDDLGTAVNVQAMVFGNMGEDCATGVGFTRNPSNGEKPPAMSNSTSQDCL